VPIGLAVALARRTGARWGSFGLGALTFGLSQVVHLPMLSLASLFLDAPILAMDPAYGVVASAVLLGLLAGLCEETARWALFRVAPGRRPRDEGLMVGLGHGGIESILFGTVGALWGLVQLVEIERAGGPAAVGLTGAELAAVEAAMATVRDEWWAPAVAALERLLVLPFHVSATMLVLWGIVRKKWWTLPLAIVWHAVLDGVAVWVVRAVGPMQSELWLLLTVPVGLGMIVALHRALPAPELLVTDPEIAAAVPRGVPLELFRATKRYGTTVALEEASMVLEKGARTCLLGPNGAGKTTTIRLALGALAPTAGRVWLFGAEHGSIELVAGKRRTGVVPQQPGMYEDLTVRQYLELVRELYGRGDVEAIAAELELGPLLDRPMAKHSGGQQRRIALAAALLPEPDLLVLDEPSAGLDPIAQKTMREILGRVGAGRTVLLCTHDLDEAEALSERVVVLEKGRVKVHERIDVLRARHPSYVRIRAAGSAEAIVRAMDDAGVPGGTATDRGVRAALPGGRATVPALLRALLGVGVDVEECTIEEASLEEIFLAAVERRGSLPPERPPAEPPETTNKGAPP
jgi:ABC-2 type transport system ATP-binding protein